MGKQDTGVMAWTYHLASKNMKVYDEYKSMIN